MKVMSKSFISSLIAIIFLLTGATSAWAAQKTNADAFFKSGFPSYVISATYYWEQNTVASLGYSTWTSTARGDYEDISGSNIVYLPATSESSADLRIYSGDYYWADYAGKMQPYLSDGTAVDLNTDPTVTWYKAHVLINDGYMDQSSSYNNYQRQKVVVHELGHALSLVHQDWFSESVMEQGIVEETGVDYRHPLPLDISNLQWKY